eukprot:m.22820 g.22820  ORF g.22820 m.22820 type:complete len:595 (-) comp8900_c1_seq1:70-1854(-)
MKKKNFMKPTQTSKKKSKQFQTLPPLKKKSNRINKHIDPDRHGIKRNIIRHVWITVNGNVKIPKAQVTLDPRTATTLDKFLDILTTAMKDTDLGLVRCLHSAASGEQVQEVNEIKDGGLYVACGRKPFQAQEYVEAVDYKERNEKYKQPNLKKITAKVKETIVVKESNVQTSHKLTRAILLYLIYNGENNGDHTNIVLKPRERRSLQQVLDLITDKMGNKLKNGPAKYLYTMSGEEVTDVMQLKDGRFDGVSYVVVDKLPLKIPNISFVNGSVVLPKAPERPPKTKKKRRKKNKKSKGTLATIDEQQQQEEENPNKQLSVDAEDIYDILLEEVLVEMLSNIIGQSCRTYSRLQHEVEGHLLKVERKIKVIDRSFDDFIHNILYFVIQRESVELWQTQEQDAVARLHLAFHAACEGHLAHWEGAPEPLAALLVLLDQLPRSFGSPTEDMYRMDNYALEVLIRSQETGVFDAMEPLHKLFACFVLSRQESAYYQDVCLQLWYSIKDTLPESYTAFGDIFSKNKEVIDAFGRFPNRNELLGRESSPQELQWIEEEYGDDKKKKKKKSSSTSFGRKKSFQKRGSRSFMSMKKRLKFTS